MHVSLLCKIAFLYFERNQSIDDLFSKNFKENSSINSTENKDNSVDCKSNFTENDFYFWSDIYSTLLSLVDRVVLINDEIQSLKIEQTPSIILKYYFPQSNQIYRQFRREKISRSIQTSIDQKRNVKIQTNTFLLFPSTNLSLI